MEERFSFLITVSWIYWYNRKNVCWVNTKRDRGTQVLINFTSIAITWEKQKLLFSEYTLWLTVYPWTLKYCRKALQFNSLALQVMILIHYLNLSLFSYFLNDMTKWPAAGQPILKKTKWPALKNFKPLTIQLLVRHQQPRIRTNAVVAGRCFWYTKWPAVCRFKDIIGSWKVQRLNMIRTTQTVCESWSDKKMRKSLFHGLT